MPFDPDSSFAPADPSQWRQTGVLPRIIVHPKPPPNVAASDGIDDWFVPGQAPNSTNLPNVRIAPWSAETDASYPDDWIYPDNRSAPTPSAAPRSDQPELSPQPNAPNSVISNRPALPPDPFAAYWSLIPASSVGALAWAPPFFPSSNPFSPQSIPASAWVTPPPIFPNPLGQFPAAANAQPDLPLDIGAHGLLGGIGRMLAERAKADDPWAAAANGILGGIAKMLAASASPSPLSAAGSRGLLGALANLQPEPLNAQADTSYLPGSRSFLSPDPIAYQGASNLYRYVENDPLDRADSTGLAADQPATTTPITNPSRVASDSGPSGPPEGGPSVPVAAGTFASGVTEAFDPADVVLTGGQYNVKKMLELNQLEAKALQELFGEVGPGPYAPPNGGVPLASPYGRGTAAERAQNNANGAEFGCHTCGTKNFGTKSGNPILAGC